jgi:hypothetical protein
MSAIITITSSDACFFVDNGLNASACAASPAGGVVRAYIGNHSDLASIGLTGATSGMTPNGSQVYQIVGPGGTGATVGFIYEYQLPKNTASVVENQFFVNDTPAGFEQIFNFVVNGFSTENRDAIMQLSQSTVFLVVQLVNGDLWMYGVQNGMTMTAMADTTGVSSTELQTYNVTISTTTEPVMKYKVLSTAGNGSGISTFAGLVVPTV